MRAPFKYPSTSHERRHGPAGYADYEGYRPWLRDEFAFRCVYCLTRETWGPFRNQFAIDHFLPVVTQPDGPASYANLLYSCVTCNGVKGVRAVPDPLATLLDGSVWVEPDGSLHAQTAEAAHLIELLDLNHPRKVEFRSLWIAVVNLSRREDPDLHRRITSYPDDLPDLSRLRPPAGNSRPDGIAKSHHARRGRGELPATY
jgi:hypothetical protein